ncbi:MAG TPA: hypothetical protein VL860_08530 [Planctomycetota bacterium]|nr:hypothetical protein [Planctomycetota bacterium]
MPQSDDTNDWDDRGTRRRSNGADSGDRDDKLLELQRRQDADHLKILSIVYYVLAALPLLGLCVMPFMLLGGPAAWCMGSFALALILVIAGINYTVARNLARRQGHLFCIVIAAIHCLSFPIGTLIGVFTIIVLLRPTVKTEFGIDVTA